MRTRRTTNGNRDREATFQRLPRQRWRALPLPRRMGGVGLLQTRRKKIRRTFAREAEAKSWRADAQSVLAKGGLRAPKPTTVRQAWEAWYEEAKAGTLRNRTEEAEARIAAALEGDQAIWATALYAGLRLGELQALRVEDVDLAAGVVRVERGWDPVEGEIQLKSEAGRRKVPIAAVLRD